MAAMIFISCTGMNLLGKGNSKGDSLSGAVEQTECSEPRPTICTMVYQPVCAEIMDGSALTYSSGCKACADTNVQNWMPNACDGEGQKFW